ncbi:DUF559 domain-containing protein [Paenibacillus polymyxa]|uniref:DUF7487 domain-containing protein n=1 Tax=Paenibacillus polymyxa TaxID=1406 RepID=UPI002AB51920|nr:DUF559 domain-containing protein [Paenibacillus polymyxa]MDY8021275.1 DUF559 domain-containing protein [Paenibacillus polymyxa]
MEVKNILITTEIKINWSNKTRGRYEGLGYKFTKYGNTFMVNISHLSLGSAKEISYLCDYCLDKGEQKILKNKYCSYIERRKIVAKDCCKDCTILKRKDVLLEKYGVENVFQLQDTKNKIISTNLKKYGTKNYTKTEEYTKKKQRTCIERYGTLHPTQSDKIKEKTKNTNLRKYGVKNVMHVPKFKNKMNDTILQRYGATNISQTEGYREKFKQTSLKNWGTESPLQNKDVREKIRKTIVQRYGCDNPLKNEDIQKKQMQTLMKNGNVPTSSQQMKIFEMLSKDYNVTLNYSVGRCFFDIALLFDDVKIDIEYDGAAFHKHRQKEDRKRDEFAKAEGWKVLRIKSAHKVPYIEEMKVKIESLINTEHTYSEIVLDDWLSFNRRCV